MKNIKNFILGFDIKRKKNLKKGFTLIELLVVIAIIGILTSITYVSLDSARARSKDKTVQTQLANMKVQAEVYYDQNDKDYSGVCTALPADFGLGATHVDGLLKKTQQATGIVSLGPETTLAVAGTWETVTCHASTNGWAVEAPTSKSKEDDPKMYCIDSTPKIIQEIDGNLAANDISC